MTFEKRGTTVTTTEARKRIPIATETTRVMIPMVSTPATLLLA